MYFLGANTVTLVNFLTSESLPKSTTTPNVAFKMNVVTLYYFCFLNTYTFTTAFYFKIKIIPYIYLLFFKNNYNIIFFINMTRVKQNLILIF